MGKNMFIGPDKCPVERAAEAREPVERTMIETPLASRRKRMARCRDERRSRKPNALLNRREDQQQQLGGPWWMQAQDDVC